MFLSRTTRGDDRLKPFRVLRCDLNMDTGAHASVSHANSQLGIPKLESSVSINPLGYEYDIQSHGNAYFVRRDLLGLFAFRRAAMGHANPGIDIGRSAAIGADLGQTPNKPVSVATFAPVESISARIYVGQAYAGVAIATDAMTTVRLPTLGSNGHIDISGFDLHLAAAMPGSLSLVLENWDDSGVHSRTTRTSTIGEGADIVSVAFPPPPPGSALNPVLFLQVSQGCDALLTHLQMRVNPAI